ncbi:MAG TPA: hypothetical protein VHN99_11595 [Deinococcales bacterium]|nr:hypothetical protein [Deinococcales bacterium]
MTRRPRLLAAVLLAACSPWHPINTGPGRVEPSRLTLAVGQSAQASFNFNPGGEPACQSDRPGVAACTPAGPVTGVAPGTAHVALHDTHGNLGGPATVTVVGK